MASSILRQLGDATARRLAEEVVERGIREGLAAHEDENRISRRILKMFFAEDSAFATRIRAIPGVRYAPHIALNVGAEYLSENAQRLLPGDNRLIVKMVREILTHAAPALSGTGDAIADVLETQVDDAVNHERSSSAIAEKDRKGLLDQGVFVWIIDGKRVLIIPIRDSQGRVQRDEFGDPIPVNLRDTRLDLYYSDRFTKKGTRKVKNKDGKGEHDVPIDPEKRKFFNDMEFAQAIQHLEVLEGLSTSEADQIREMFKPKPSWESRLSPDVDRVLDWIVDAVSFEPLGLNNLESQETEDLVQTMKKNKPEPDWVNRRLRRFRAQVDVFPIDAGQVYTVAQIRQIKNLFKRIRDEIDITLGGEQSVTTQTRKILQAIPEILRKLGEILSASAPWVSRGLEWWRDALVLAIVLLSLGVFIPVNWFGVPWFTLLTMFIAVCGGVIGFAITWPFPAVQKAYDFIGDRFGVSTHDSINSIGRRIAAFALCVGAGVLPFIIWLEFPIVVRLGIVAFGGIFPIGVMFGLRELGYSDLASRLAKRSLVATNLLFGTFGVAVMVLVGLVSAYTGEVMTGPKFIRWSISQLTHGGTTMLSWFQSLRWWHWGITGAVVFFIFFVLVFLFGGGSNNKDGSGERATSLAGMMLGVAGFVGIICAPIGVVVLVMYLIKLWFI